MFSRKPAAPPEDPAGGLIDAATRLAQTLDLENAALAAFDLGRAANMVADKAIALTAFESACQQMAGRHITDPEQWYAATMLSGQLQGLAQDNRNLLERALFVQKRVIALLGRAMVNRDAPRYGSRGGLAAAVRAMAVSARA